MFDADFAELLIGMNCPDSVWRYDIEPGEGEDLHVFRDQFGEKVVFRLSHKDADWV